MLNFGSKVDFAALFGLEHDFNALNDKLDITPTFVANASTENFYSDYFRKRRYSIKRKGQKPLTGVASITGEVINAGQFQILDYEASIPLAYKLGRFTCSFTPTFAIPVNPSQLAIHEVLANNEVINKVRTEQIENVFYWNAGIVYSF